MSLLTQEEREAMWKKKGTRHTDTELAAMSTFGVDNVGDGQNVDYFYQQEAPQLWNMIVNTNDNVEALAKGLHTLGKNDQVILDRIEEISDEIKQAQDAQYWKGQCKEKDEQIEKLYAFCDRMYKGIDKLYDKMEELKAERQR